MTLGRYEEKIVNAALARGDSIPQSILEAPEVRHDLAFFWSAFHALSSCRNFGMSVGPIPWTAIAEYAGFHNVFDFEEFEEIIRRMDSYYLDLIFSDQEKSNGRQDHTNSSRH